ncbi:MAG: DNA mismatch repair endonuclease MutL [Anaerovibrio sp.]|uniref:DNA mismatch repair endonuclease MutL n=1 Tax=Anaerovibrio sp. TaxID=1872532 RepID=UPI00260E37FE|nr:DNA mismatch repair endonuclease MutL [Anaerovibrio sp.]MDD7677532.1 DNA mismatch repair endonuclease MutL [Anaerovibrio sp.]MDY2603124.1 DNA mismatch repair endonuclease MutL [Anaerovibrio sp.]
MSFVHVLDDNTINKIAAGEVVERPASVIKELVENAIDAHADRIQVEIAAGGTSFMRVSDNGIGMSRQDAELAILRHATSKIVKVDDLLTIGTLGFRGEALPSIASVSRFTLTTRQAGDELGTEIKISGGSLPEIGETGCGIGTTIRVEDLFFNTPARKKFLKTNNTEGGKINEFIVKLAISNPQIAFKLLNNNKVAVSTPGNGDLKDTLQSIYGGTVGSALLPLEFEDEDIRLSGFVTKPSAIRSSRSWQTFIVNGRVIANRAIAKAIDNAYHALIPKTGYPLVALNIQVPQNTIDVNVHPQKSEMKFEDEGRVFKAVYKAVLDAIRPKDEVRQLGKLGNMAAGVEQAEIDRHVAHGMQDLHDMSPAAGKLYMENLLAAKDVERASASPARYVPVYEERRQAAMQWREAAARMDVPKPAEPESENVPETVPELVSVPVPEMMPVPEAVPETMPVENDREQSCRMVPIGQVDNTYIIAQDADGLYIVDQHAAHERILFDRFSARAGEIPVQQLLVHLMLDFSSHEAEIIEDNLAMLKELGFGMEPSGPKQFRLTEVPADVPSGEAEDFIREILASLEELHKPSAAELRQAAIATASCKAAIKAGFKLNFRQMEILLAELNDTAMPYTCPHGRPTIIRFSTDELAKMFKRTGF